jgi:hypothetical protein
MPYHISSPSMFPLRVFVSSSLLTFALAMPFRLTLTLITFANVIFFCTAQLEAFRTGQVNFRRGGAEPEVGEQHSEAARVSVLVLPRRVLHQRGEEGRGGAAGVHAPREGLEGTFCCVPLSAAMCPLTYLLRCVRVMYASMHVCLHTCRSTYIRNNTRMH